MLDVFKLAQVEERTDDRVGFKVNPDDMYPATIEHIRGVLKGGKRPSDAALGILYEEAKRLPDVAWDLALRPYDDTALMEREAVEARAAALEVARKWFTEMLHQAIGHEAMALHIIRGSGNWRL